MDEKNLTCVVGEAKEGEVAQIRFFGKINEDSAKNFNAEFDYLENCVRPKLIRVLINCEGGSVLHGMTVFSTIQNSKVPTECVNEGMCASMGSVIWSAGNRSLMRDYSILMIHCPFVPNNSDENDSDLVQAFTNQLKTIYRKRFGLNKEKVEAIMAGETGKDGTFFDAKGAVKAGIIPAENVIKTSKQLVERVQNEVSNMEDVDEIHSLMTRICAEADTLEIDFKQSSDPTAISCPTASHTNDNNLNQSTMSNEKNFATEYSAITANLGLKDNFELKDVMARVSELVGVEAALTKAKTDLSDAQTVIAGKEATIQNLEKDKTELTASLKIYQDKESNEKRTRIENMVNTAVDDGKIEASSKDQWITMAWDNEELADKTLASIPKREQISKEIASDPENIQAAKEGAKTEDEKLATKVNEVVGENFKFGKING